MTDNVGSAAAAPISGYCHPDFSGVQREFAANFAERGEVGAALCVIVDGETVIDLVGGWSDEARTTPWAPTTMVNFYSVGKAIAALLVLRAVDAGSISLDTAVADVWPEFAQHGKGDVSVRHALCHLAGVPALRAPRPGRPPPQACRQAFPFQGTTTRSIQRISRSNR